MQSSYNVIKSQFAVKGEVKTISTEYTAKNFIPEVIEEEITKEKQNIEPQINPEEILKRYENIGMEIVEDAKRKKEKILSEADLTAQNIEKEAYEKGYDQGTKNGYEDGYKKAYDENIDKAKQEANEIVMKAEEILRNAKSDYTNYLEDKKNEIINLALDIASNIVKEKLSKEDSMNKLINEAFSISKNEENIIIKINPIYSSEVKKNIEKWKIEYAVKGEIFIIEDEKIAEGNAILEKTSGIVKVGLDTGMEQIKKALFS